MNTLSRGIRQRGPFLMQARILRLEICEKALRPVGDGRAVIRDGSQHVVNLLSDFSFALYQRFSLRGSAGLADCAVLLLCCQRLLHNRMRDQLVQRRNDGLFHHVCAYALRARAASLRI
jgi:hypothetical protein